MSEHDQRIVIEPLNRDNYVSWCEDMKAILLDRDSWGIVKGKEESPAATASARDKKDYETRKNRGYSTIYLNIAKDLRSLITDTEDPAKAWEILKVYFQPESRARLMGLLDVFFGTRPDPDETLGIYAARLRNVIRQVKDAGHELDDMFQAFQLIRFLPDEFTGIIQTIYRWEEDEFKFDKVLKELLCEEARLKQCRSDSVSCGTNVFNVNSRNKDLSSKKKKKSKNVTCIKCGKKNHTAAQCRSNFKAKIFAANVETSFIAESNLNEVEESNCWIFDTAATAHFSGNKSIFTTFKPIKNREMSLAAGGTTYPIEGIGNVNLMFNEDTNTPQEVSLLNVMYSPKINKNLIAGSKFDEAGAKFIGSKGKVTIFTPSGKRMFVANKSNGLYKCFPTVKSVTNPTVNLNVVKSSNFGLWHRKFCHINSKFLVNTSKNNSVRGLPQFKHSKFSCEPCKIAKARRQPHQSINGPRSKFPLELIHSDLAGPLPVNSVNGHRYFLSFIDDFSGKVTVYPLKDKTQVFECFTRFQKRAERFLNRKIINVRTDNGLEYTHEKFKKFLEKQGIHAERSNVYTPQQNGTAERFNLTALDAIKVMLEDSSLNNSFWSEAVLCFTYVWNRVCHGNQDKTPFEKYGGQTPSVKHLKIFGSKAFVVIPKQRRTKLDVRAKRGVMVGYAMSTRGYRIWLPAENKVIETSDVRFDEPVGDLSKSGRELDPDPTRIFTYGYDTGSNDDESDEESDKKEPEPDQTTDFPPPILDGQVWRRRAVKRKEEPRLNIYYDLVGTDVKLNSSVKAKKYCQENNFKFDPQFFDYSGSNTYSGIMPGSLESLNLSEVNKEPTL